MSLNTHIYVSKHTHTLGRGNPFYCISLENCREVWSSAYCWADVIFWLNRPVSTLITLVNPTFNLIRSSPSEERVNNLI